LGTSPNFNFNSINFNSIPQKRGFCNRFSRSACGFWGVVDVQAEGVFPGVFEDLRNGRVREADVGGFFS